MLGAVQVKGLAVVSVGVPPFACQLTLVFVVPVTVAEKLWASPGARLIVEGDTVTWIGSDVTVTAEVATLVGSAWLCAVIVTVAAAGGAVQLTVLPVASTTGVPNVPCGALHVTALFDVPPTAATKLVVRPDARVSVAGDTEIVTTAADTVRMAAADLVGSAAPFQVFWFFMKLSRMDWSPRWPLGKG